MYKLKHCRECYMKNKARGNEAEMPANIARGEVECYISIEAECRVLYFGYSTSKAINALTVIENFLYKFARRHYKTSNLTNISAEWLYHRCIPVFPILFTALIVHHAVCTGGENKRYKVFHLFPIL